MARTKQRKRNKRPKLDTKSNDNKKPKLDTKINDNKKKKSKPESDKKKNPLTSTSKSSDSDSDSNSSDSSTRSDNIQKLLEPYSKEQLIDFLSSAAVSDASLLSLIRSAADRDVSHRKIFVHGFGWDVTREILVSVFQSYGEIEDCNVVTDKATGRAKGYGFVIFKTRAAAMKALKQPQKQIKGRAALCQLASVGPTSAPPGGDVAIRKIYVSNVHSGVDPDKLRTFFARFGEIETGPTGFDPLTGKSRGFALFVYKTVEGARKALEEPHKVFDGHQLHCQLAAADPARAMVPQLPPGPAALAAAAAAQNLALFTQNPTLNPAFNAMVGNSASGLMAGNSLVAGSGLGTDFGGYGSGLSGLNGGSPSVLGPYGMQGQAGQAYQSLLGQSSASRAYKGGGSLSGIPPYML